MEKRNFIKYFLLFSIILITVEISSFLIISKLENHRWIKSIILNQENSNVELNKIKKKYRDILPYIRDPNNFKNSNNYIISYDPSHLLYTIVNPYSFNNLENILIQGDSWAEIANKKKVYDYVKMESNKKSFGIINAGITSYSPSPMSVQLFILRKDFKVYPTVIIAIIDQTDIADELYRYNTPDWSENKINYFDLEHEEPLIRVFSGKSFSIVKIFNIAKIFFVSKKKKFNGDNSKTLKYFFQRAKIFISGTPTVLFPLVNGVSDNDKKIFTERINNYIDIAFQDKNLKKIIFVTHPHKNHLTKNNKKYKAEVGQLIKEIIVNSNYKDKINHIDFYRKDKAVLEQQNINNVFHKDDVYSHLTEEMYLNYYYPYILNNINIK